MVTSADPGSVSSTGLAYVFDAHSLRWRCFKLRDPLGDSNADGDATNRRSCRRSRRVAEPFCPSRARLWTTDNVPCVETYAALPCRERRRLDAPAPALSVARDSDPHSPSHSPWVAGETPAAAGETPATAGETRETAGETPATAGETRATAGETPATAGPFLGDDLMGMEPLARVVSGSRDRCCSSRHSRHNLDPYSDSFLSFEHQHQIRGRVGAWELHSRLEQLPYRNNWHVVSLHIPVLNSSDMKFIRGASSCPGTDEAAYNGLPASALTTLQPQ
ncbi:hypothetical protein CLOM_g10892 [Closterium sp. NIES-68]|nr:hypothetical protein CLOM_g10892 [Closterium sp. NIES-68]GJP74856.1 hypothetical protein CLOP_g5385 [Closterium sp. NIES-67]